MNKNTFSSSKAAQNLVTILDQPEYKEFSSKTSKLISRCFKYFSRVMFIPDKTIREATLNLWKKEFLDNLPWYSLPTIVRTHALNVVIGYFKQCLREQEPRRGNSVSRRRQKLSI